MMGDAAYASAETCKDLCKKTKKTLSMQEKHGNCRKDKNFEREVGQNI